MKTIRAAALRTLLLITVAASSAWALPRHAPVPGGVAVVRLDADTAARPVAWFGDAPLAVVRADGAWYALVGIPLALTPGPQSIVVATDGSRRRIDFEVTPNTYPTQRLQIRDRSKVTPRPEDEPRIEREQLAIAALKRHYSEAASPDPDFSPPADGPLSSRFGLRRILNGEPRSPHAGLDVTVPAGAPIVAPAPGTVLDVGDYFFTGNTVFIDHGQGLITLFAHLSRVDVRPGQTVGRGEPIGACGATGRATGPHLHWAAVLNGTPVDPELFLPPQEASHRRPANQNP